MTSPSDIGRRRFLLATAAAAAGLSFADSNLAFARELAPTPECKDGDEPTIRQTEGPFFKPKSPERVDLCEKGQPGRPFELAGLVLTRRCQPVAGALVDLWHADDNGDYDNRGFRGRGHQFTDAQGRFKFLTIRPALYPGRTRHFHVKLQAAKKPILTTQLYFPGDATANARDSLFRRELLMRVAEVGDGLTGRFDFVLDMS